MAKPILKVEQLRVHFYTADGVVRAVDGINWELEAGGTLGIVGESGCGKSVTALSLLRLIPNPPGKIVDGKIIYSGRDILKLSQREIRAIRGNDISMVFQDPVSSLNPVYTVGNQVNEALRLHQKVNNRQAEKKAIELLHSVGIPSPEQRLKEYPHQLSGGMNQRVMIAMALACDPKILIADEPTTALDVTIQAQILNLLKTIKQQSNMAIILITHDLGVICQLVENVIVMYAGKIVESGSIEDIFQRPFHPYTKGLLKSIPQMDVRKNKNRARLLEIKGVVPNLIDPIEGCVFYPRCESRLNHCEFEEPSIKKVGPNHQSACWLD